ncbi:unnamed protein product [Closterium sp. NIES-53]
MASRNLRAFSYTLHLTLHLLSVLSAASSAGLSENAPASAPAPSPGDDIVPDIPGIDYSVNITLPVVSGTSGDSVGPPVCFRQGLSPHPVPIPCGDDPSQTASSQTASRVSQMLSLASARQFASSRKFSRPLVDDSTPKLTPATELFDICTGQARASPRIGPHNRSQSLTVAHIRILTTEVDSRMSLARPFAVILSPAGDDFVLAHQICFSHRAGGIFPCWYSVPSPCSSSYPPYPPHNPPPHPPPNFQPPCQ